RDRLVHDDRAPEGDALLRVLERVLVGRTRDTQRLRTDERTARLERAHRGLHAARLSLARTRDPIVELLLAAEQAVTGHAHVGKDHLGGMAGANAHLLELLAHREPRGPGRNDERRVPAALQ